MKRILVLFAHPHPQKSHANSKIVSSMRRLPNVTVRDLYDLYPYFHINVRDEQAALREHDILVFQHPVYWYSVPPLLKLWFDEVLELGFAYGKSGTALKGKQVIWSVTTGGDAGAYSETGYHHSRFEAFHAPIRHTVELCGMKWNEPAVLHGSVRADLSAIEEHSTKLIRRLNELAKDES